MLQILASFIFFTRLPFWRIRSVPTEYFKHVVPYWPMVGWFTGGVMALSLWGLAHLFPLSLAWILAIVIRLLITGCLHEDGFADFCDGMGGGNNREKILAIMKDSHIGTYGVIGLTIYFLTMTQMHLLPLNQLCIVVFCADCWSKFCASQIINFLPYARSEAESKNKVIYKRMNSKEFMTSVFFGSLPIVVFLPIRYWPSIIIPVLVSLFLFHLMKKRIQGYTGDCCGATFILCEISFYLTSLAIYLQTWKLF